MGEPHGMGTGPAGFAGAAGLAPAGATGFSAAVTGAFSAGAAAGLSPVGEAAAGVAGFAGFGARTGGVSTDALTTPEVIGCAGGFVSPPATGVFSAAGFSPSGGVGAADLVSSGIA